MKKFAKLICPMILSAAAVLGTAAYAEEDVVSVYLDNEKVEFDQPPIIIDGSTLVPVRAVFEKAGAVVTWDQETLTATLKKENYTVNITLGDSVLYKNGTEIALNTPAAMAENRILIPVRAIGEAMDFDVKWDGFHSTVFISTDGTEYRPYTARKVAAFKDLPDAAEFYSAKSFDKAEIDLDGDGITETVSFAKKYDHVLSGEPALVINDRDLTLDFESFSSTYSFAVIDTNIQDNTKEVVVTENGDTLSAHFYRFDGEKLVPVNMGSDGAKISYASRLLFDTKSYIISDLEGLCFTDIMVTGSLYQLEDDNIKHYKINNASKIIPRKLLHTYDDNMIYNYVNTDGFSAGSYRDLSDGTISAAEIGSFMLEDMYIYMNETDPVYYEFYIMTEDGRHLVLTPYRV